MIMTIAMIIIMIILIGIVVSMMIRMMLLITMMITMMTIKARESKDHIGGAAPTYTGHSYPVAAHTFSHHFINHSNH